MGRRLNEKLPRVTIPSERITEAHWQQLLRERDAQGKLRQIKSLQTASSQYNTVTLLKEMASCSTRAVTTNCLPTLN